jgi:glutathione S-transferase
MKLYYAKGACSLAVRIVINEIELSCQYESVDLKTKQTETSADFLKINPKGSVPVLVTNEQEVLTENLVIQQYLADTYHAYQLLPKLNDFNRYRTLEWLNYVATELHKGFSPLFNPEMPQEVKDKIVIPVLDKKFAYLNHHLQEHAYLMGKEFTLPDSYLFVVLRWEGL